MTKKLCVENVNMTGTATTSRWKKATDTIVLNNTATSPIRIDKFMLGESMTASGPAGVVSYVGLIVQMSDTNGNFMTDAITGGAADTNAALTALMEKWKDYIWMTDFRAVMPGTAIPPSVFDMEAGTKRVLEPGQKLAITTLWMCGNDNSAANLNTMQDYALWYQAAAQS